ncbi:uncharacterized protein KY384_002448 [Bacidia gigantensis]|uniref:uncharacterized protein n=1 Tax=Bacidia gigantensis TaxID=2732470 RepID=UPI001D052E19|nr:uncharacterized protein KY384_002448 [Bacidia gigantensis]KAG8532571.1 hypothetical protein KY384_002448 [Bacidia gigantensis]
MGTAALLAEVADPTVTVILIKRQRIDKGRGAPGTCPGAALDGTTNSLGAHIIVGGITRQVYPANDGQVLGFGNTRSRQTGSPGREERCVSATSQTTVIRNVEL